MEQERLIKLDAAGERLPLEAAEWAAVEDTSTGLIWDRRLSAPKRLAWAKAKAAAEAVTICGKPARLPSIRELLSIVDYDRYDPAIDTRFFDCESNWYWTSTPAAASPSGCAWVVYFNGGSANWGDRGFRAFVRAVRDARVP